MTKDIAIAHEHWIEYGGGEYVAETLAENYDAPLYTGLVDMDEPERIDMHEVTASIPLRHHLAKSILLRDGMYMLAWPNTDLTDYDVVIQSGNGSGWYVPRDDQAIVKYAHTTPRGAYDLYHENDHGVFGTVAQHAVRTLYQHTVPYPDVWVANSELVARRIRRYFGVDADRVRVVYPPVDTHTYDSRMAPTDGRMYLTWSRLYEHKNIDDIVRAFNRLGSEYRLIVGGTGPERDDLESVAGENVSFVGYLSEDRKRELAAKANAVLFAATNEDFGLVPIEAMASGTPVIGVEDGYTKHQIRDGENGVLFRGGADEIAQAIVEFDAEGVAWSGEQIEAFAQRNFGMERFFEQMDNAIQDATDRATVTANHEVPTDV